MALLKEVESICRELRNKNELGISLGSQALILFDRGDLNGAMALFYEVERICRELGDKQGLVISLANQSLILGTGLNQPAAALRIADEAYRIAAGYGNKDLVNQIKAIRSEIKARMK
jgi:hypothetical protein